MGFETVSVEAGRISRPGVDGDAVSASGGRGRADDAGFTPAEIIIGVILVGILATGVTIKAIQLMDRARDSAAQKTLRAADVAAQAAFSVMLPGGQSNYASQKLTADNRLEATDKAYTEAAADLVIKAIQDQEPGISLKSKRGASAETALNAMASDGQVWVEVNNKTIKNTAAQTIAGTNPNGHSARTSTVALGVSIRAGEMIRLGIVAASGSTFCVISVADSSDGTISGDGWQAVNELLSIGGKGADCGADISTADLVQKEFVEMPGTPGTDPSLSQTRQQPERHRRQRIHQLI